MQHSHLLAQHPTPPSHQHKICFVFLVNSVNVVLIVTSNHGFGQVLFHITQWIYIPSSPALIQNTQQFLLSPTQIYGFISPMAPGPCPDPLCCGHGWGATCFYHCIHCSWARRAHRRGKFLCVTYHTVFTEGVELDEDLRAHFYSALIYRVSDLDHPFMHRGHPFVHRLTATDVETYYKMVWTHFFVVDFLTTRICTRELHDKIRQYDCCVFLFLFFG